jgi:hypothetical protein
LKIEKKFSAVLLCQRAVSLCQSKLERIGRRVLAGFVIDPAVMRELAANGLVAAPVAA